METSGNFFVTFLGLILRNIPVALILAAVVIPLYYMRRSAFAVIKRNFNGYFSNPTGYVFLCVFVLLTSLAAFWPHGFFHANLANLDQLNDFLPLIMLIYIPAITMGIWSEERRDGTVHVSAISDATAMDIRIQDGGGGIESHDVEHIFHPFFTTKSGALGLGLAIVRQVAETHASIAGRP